MDGQMTLFDLSPECAPPSKCWQYDEDTGSVLCRCPDCEGRMVIGPYQYNNPYRYCPYCGIRLSEGRIAAKRRQVYGK